MKLLIIITKIISIVSRGLGLGSGATWPGEILLKVYPDSFSYFLSKFEKGAVFIAGTNGKTTTSAMTVEILKGEQDVRIVKNDTGANLSNGLVSACIASCDFLGNSRFDWGVFEVDENSLPAVFSNINPPAGGQISNKKIILVLLNLFRDQLDRYGEVDIIAKKWEKAIKTLPGDATLILNADDPQIAYFGKNVNLKTLYFGINQKDKYLTIKEHATDSTYCPVCAHPLTYEGTYFSHLGVWKCSNCGFKRPDIENISLLSPLPGLYSLYNLYAAYLVGSEVGIYKEKIKDSLSNFTPAFGRQEEIEYKNRKVKVFLSKNPAGFNASLRAVLDLKPKVILLVLNDRIPDGRDVSWIYDVDFELLPDSVSIICSGDRVYDMAVRMKYTIKHPDKETMEQLIVKENLSEALDTGVNQLNKDETLYILPTYSAMLEVRKILTGKKIL